VPAPVGVSPELNGVPASRIAQEPQGARRHIAPGDHIDVVEAREARSRVDSGRLIAPGDRYGGTARGASPVGRRFGRFDLLGRLPSGSPQRIATWIEFPSDYPDHEPLAFETARRFRHDADHHFYANDRCCLWLDVETKWRPGDRDALRRFLDELSLFYYRQLMMEANPRLSYPRLSSGHGVLGYLEYLEERLRLRAVDLPPDAADA
jgi:hypothetical protein